MWGILSHFNKDGRVERRLLSEKKSCGSVVSSASRGPQRPGQAAQWVPGLPFGARRSQTTHTFLPFSCSQRKCGRCHRSRRTRKQELTALGRLKVSSGVHAGRSGRRAAHGGELGAGRPASSHPVRGPRARGSAGLLCGGRLHPAEHVIERPWRVWAGTGGLMSALVTQPRTASWARAPQSRE